MAADPVFRAVTVGARAGAVAPAVMIRLAGATLTVEGSLLESERNTPPAGAAVPRLTGKGAVWFICTLTPEGTTMPVPLPPPVAVIVTVEGTLLASPLLTISCAT